MNESKNLPSKNGSLEVSFLPELFIYSRPRLASQNNRFFVVIFFNAHPLLLFQCPSPVPALLLLKSVDALQALYYLAP